MPRSAARNAQLRAESRTRLLHAALTTFAAHGVEGSTVRMIADAAGVTPGLLYAYFASKEALLEACFAASMQDVRETFAAADAERDPAARIAALVRSSAVVIRRNLDFWRLSYGVRMQPAAQGRLAPLVTAWRAQITKTLTRYCRQAGSTQPRIDAAALFAAIDGVHQHFVMDPAHYPLDDVLETVIQRFTVARVSSRPSSARPRRSGAPARPASRTSRSDRG